MRFAIVSDLHFDYHKPKIVAKVIGQLVDMLDANEVDWIIFPGDLSTGGLVHDPKKIKLWRELMEPIADRTIFTPGSHDFYGVTFPDFWDRIPEIGFAHVLNNNTIELDDLTIYGGPLWFEKPLWENPSWKWCDDEWIMGDQRTHIYQASADFKCNMPQYVDIVVSHHIPTARSQHARFLGDRTNCFFLNDCEEIIRCVQMQYWVHGHSHDYTHYQFNQHTKVICNPLGYPNNDTGRYTIKIIEVNGIA